MHLQWYGKFYPWYLFTLLQPGSKRCCGRWGLSSMQRVLGIMREVREPDEVFKVWIWNTSDWEWNLCQIMPRVILPWASLSKLQEMFWFLLEMHPIWLHLLQPNLLSTPRPMPDWMPTFDFLCSSSQSLFTLFLELLIMYFQIIMHQVFISFSSQPSTY